MANPEPRGSGIRSRGGLHDRTVRDLGLRILRGHLRPGEVLRLEDLEREYGVSRSVIREAVRVLASKGMVDARPKRGTYVRPRRGWTLVDPDVLRWQSEDPDPRFFDNLAELRMIVEPAVARIAAQRREAEDVERIDTALAGMAEADLRSRGFVTADLDFHGALLEATHNELLQSLEPVIEAGLWARDLVVHRLRQAPDSLLAHNRVADAVRSGDGAAAEAAMRDLLAQSARDFEDARDEAGRGER